MDSLFCLSIRQFTKIKFAKLDVLQIVVVAMQNSHKIEQPQMLHLSSLLKRLQILKKQQCIDHQHILQRCSTDVLLYIIKSLNRNIFHVCFSSQIEAKSGLRLVELRSVPEGVVFHHWEFLTDRPPTTFRIKHSEILTLSPTAQEFTVLAEDSFGNVMKKKFSMVEIQSLDSTPVTPTEKLTTG